MLKFVWHAGTIWDPSSTQTELAYAHGTILTQCTGKQPSPKAKVTTVIAWYMHSLIVRFQEVLMSKV